MKYQMVCLHKKSDKNLLVLLTTPNILLKNMHTTSLNSTYTIIEHNFIIK